MLSETLGIRAAAYHLPPRRRTVEEWADANRAGPDMLANLKKNGVAHYYDSENLPPLEMASEALEQALSRAEVAPDQIDLLIFAHTVLLSPGPPLSSIASELRRRFKLTNALPFSITQQNCVSILAALRIVRTMQRSGRVRNAVIVSADQMRRLLGDMRAIGDIAMHTDGASALVVSSGWERNRLASLVSYAEAGSYLGPLDRLEPNGTFFLSAVSVMRRAIQAAGISQAQIARVLPSHVNRPAWDEILRLLRIPPERLFDQNFLPKGHAFGSDWIINLVDLGPAEGPLLAFSNGLSGCFGAAVVQP